LRTETGVVAELPVWLGYLLVVYRHPVQTSLRVFQTCPRSDCQDSEGRYETKETADHE